MKIILEAQCEGGHSQKITYEGDWVGMEYVETFAKMLTGENMPPLPKGPVFRGPGKCGKCGTQIHCSITKDNEHPPCMACYGTGYASPFDHAEVCPVCKGAKRIAA